MRAASRRGAEARHPRGQEGWLRCVGPRRYVYAVNVYDSTTSIHCGRSLGTPGLAALPALSPTSQPAK